MRNNLKKNKTFAIILMIINALLITTPLIILILGPKNEGRLPILDVSVGLGFIGLAMMTLQFVVTARIKPLNKPFGTDLIYHYHRQIGIASFLLVFAHPILLFILDDQYLRLLNPITAPWRARFGVFAVLLLIGVVLTAEYREKLKIPYTFWKIWHGIMATAMIAAAVIHIFQGESYINLPWKRALWIGYSVLLIGMLINTRILYPLRLIKHSFRVKSTKLEAGDVFTLTMVPDGHAGFRFNPGQFAWLTAWKTPFSDTEHPFSLASSAEISESFQMSIKNLGPFTQRIQSLKAGERVYVDGPYGSFNLDRHPEAQRLVMIPGGIGVTPIMSMLRTMADRGDKRPILLFYCNREWETVTFKEEVKELEKKLDLKTIYTIEKPPSAWEGESGFLNRTILNKHTPEDWISDGTGVFLCGPAPMMTAVEKELLAVGYSHQQIHSERYSFA
jgi:predicted ferric reductase